MSVLPPDARLTKKYVRKVLLWTVTLLTVLIACLVYVKFFRRIEQPYEPGTVGHFKYGSIGVEENSGIPYWIWVVLPRVFPEHLPGPGGYTSLGIVWEPGEEMPVGFSKKHIGYDRVAFNCALCHTATFRTQRKDERPTTTQIVVAGPANRFDPQAYLGFLRDCADDPRFNADTLMEAIEYNVDLSWLDSTLYRYLLIPGTRKAIIEQSRQGKWMESRPIWGHGRIDPFNPVKFGMLEMEDDQTLGNSDMMPLWELEQRAKGDQWQLHWDGLVTNPYGASLAGALGDGASRKSLPVEEIRTTVDWLMDFRPTRGALGEETGFPNDQLTYPLKIKDELVKQGRGVFVEHCKKCHAPDGEYTNTTIVRKDRDALTEPPAIATDPNRIAMWNPVALKSLQKPDNDKHPAYRYNRFAKGYDYNDQLATFVGTNGYAAVPLNGIWLRGPYLHNGSVPTLHDLLNPPMSEAELETMIKKANSFAHYASSPEVQELLMSIESKLQKTENQMATMMKNLSLMANSSSSRTIDLAEITETFSRIPPPDSPPQAVSRRLAALTSLVDFSIAYARLIDRRPPMFYRGYDVLDGVHVGFVHNSDAVGKRRFPIPYLTTVPGNSNAGHEWGVKLDEADKKALVEFLKTQ